MCNRLQGCCSAHFSTCTVRCRIHGSFLSFTFYDKAGGGHRSWNNSQYILARGCRSFSMNDHFLSFVHFFPCKIVMVLHHLYWFTSKLSCDLFMNDMVTGRCVIPRQ